MQLLREYIRSMMLEARRPFDMEELMSTSKWYATFYGAWNCDVMDTNEQNWGFDDGKLVLVDLGH